MRNIKDFQERYDRWKNGESYWSIRGVDLPKYDSADKYTFDGDKYIVEKDNVVYKIDPNVSHKIYNRGKN